MHNVEKNSRTMLKSIKFRQHDFDDPRQQELIRKIRKDQEECLQFAEDKVQLAETTFDLVETHIRRLDQQLLAFEKDLQAKEGGGKGKSHKKRKTDKQSAQAHAGQQMNLGWPVGRGWLGQKVSRYWPDEGGWFEAVVTDFKIEQGGHKLTYDCGRETESFEWYDLDNPQQGDIEFTILKPLTSVQPPHAPRPPPAPGLGKGQ